MKYLDRLRELHKPPPQALTEPTEAPFVGSVGDQGEPILERRGNQSDRLATLRESFDLVMRAFGCTSKEIEVAWALALRDVAAAQQAYHADAALVRAGWRPDREHITTFLRRTGANKS